VTKKNRWPQEGKSLRSVEIEGRRMVQGGKEEGSIKNSSMGKKLRTRGKTGQIILVENKGVLRGGEKWVAEKNIYKKRKKFLLNTLLRGESLKRSQRARYVKKLTFIKVMFLRRGAPVRNRPLV